MGKKKTRAVICALKTPGRHNAVGGERMILWARTSPSLSSHPSAAPKCIATTGILHLRLSGLNQEEVQNVAQGGKGKDPQSDPSDR